MPTTERTQPDYFDQEAQTRRIRHADDEVVEAQRNADAASTELAAAEDFLARTLGNPASPTAIRDARDAQEFAAIVAGKADAALIAARAERDALATADSSLAVELVTFARALAGDHPRFTVAAGAGDLRQVPDPTIGDPVIIVRQLSPSERSPSGSLRATVELAYYFDQGLHRPSVLDRENLKAALDGVGEIWQADPNTINHAQVHDGGNVQRVELTLAAIPRVPLVTADPDPTDLAFLVERHLSTYAERRRLGFNVVARCDRLVNEHRADDGTLTRVADVMFSVSSMFLSVDGAEAMAELLAAAVRLLVDEPTATLGRVAAAEIVNLGGGRDLIEDVPPQLVNHEPDVADHVAMASALTGGGVRWSGVVARLTTVAMVPAA